ncbi:MAG TPA: hypothetical protein VF230_02485 [Acidimicrobiales bacterium]
MERRHMPDGAPVEVRTKFEGGWARGFVVDGQAGDGYVVRRMSDGRVLPAAFATDDVRPADD